MLIARAAGTSLGEFLRERLFAPLGMKDTGFSVPADKLDRLPTLYWTDFATGRAQWSSTASPTAGSRNPPPFEAGSGGLVSTVDDLLAFGQMMLSMGRFGNERILSRPSVEVMTTDQLTPEQKAASPFFPAFWDSRGWGFGGSVVTRRDDLGSLGRYGWDGGYGTSWHIDHREELVGVLLTQRTWDGVSELGLYSDFWTSAYQAIDD